MLDNLTAVAALISVAWLGLIAYYIYLSRQQTDLEQQLEELQAMLDRQEQQEET